MPANLVVQTAFLGDLLLSIPLLKRMRKLWPEQKLLLVCRKGFGEFFLKTGLVDQVFEIIKKDPASYSQAVTELAAFDLQFLISPHESWRTALFCNRIQAPLKITYRKPLKSAFFNELIQRDGNLPDPMRQLNLLSGRDPELKSLIAEYLQSARPFKPDEQGHLSAPPEFASMSLRSRLLEDSAGFASLRSRLDLSTLDFSRVILLFPGSVWATKRWTPQGYAQTGSELQQRGYQVIVMGGPGEEALSAEIASHIPGARCLAGHTSIYESALLICHARLVVGNDSASTHIASACEVPVVAVFGPTILEFGFRPWSAQVFIVEMKELACRPCGKHGHQKCPLNTHECMRHISAPEVLEKVGLALGAPSDIGRGN